MTDGWFRFVSSRPRVPRTQPTAEWEARRHEHEARFWAEHIDHFVLALPRMRLDRGDERMARLVRDVIAAVKAAEGYDAAVLARDRCADGWGRR